MKPIFLAFFTVFTSVVMADLLFPTISNLLQPVLVPCKKSSECSATQRCKYSTCLEKNDDQFHELTTTMARRALFLSTFARASYTTLNITEELAQLCLPGRYEMVDERIWPEQGYLFSLYTGRGSDILSFKGTTTSAETFKDLDMRPVNCTLALACGSVHNGFNSILNLMLPEIDKLLDARKEPILITGHSLGGALASMAALHIVNKYGAHRVKAIHMFGNPKFGDDKFVDTFEEMVIGGGVDVRRFINVDGAISGKWDPVSLIPPGSLFAHVAPATINYCLEPDGLKCSPRRLHALPLYVEGFARRVNGSWFLKHCGNYDRFAIPFV